MKNKPSAFLISPVRNISDEYYEALAIQVKSLEAHYNVYWPARDTNQSAPEKEICQANLIAIKRAKVVFIVWDGKSQGCLFDLGMAFALGKPIRTIFGYIPKMTVGKSFANLIYNLEEL